jgi:biopolymer transport protein ExbB
VRHLVQTGAEIGLVSGSRHLRPNIATPAAPAILASDDQTANLCPVRLLLASFATLLTAASARAQEALPPVRAEINLWQVVLSGGPVMIPLGILSVIAVMLILVYLFTMRRGAVVTKRYMATADALLRKRDYLGLLAISNRHREAVARVMQRTLDFVTQHPEATFADAREIAETEGTRQAAALNQRITYLADIGTIAPMLGLFGTVLGMIKSFSVVASDIVASRPIMLAEGVSEALVTTATGLVIGIPAMAAYSFFRGRTQSLIAELEAASTQLMALMSVAFTRK